MDKSSVTCTGGSDWWLSRTTMGGKERYPKQIRVGDLDRPRVYYPIDRDALLALEDEMFEDATGLAFISQLEKNEELQDLQSTMAKALMDYARRIREALGVQDA